MAYKTIASGDQAQSATHLIRPEGTFYGDLTIHDEYEALYYEQVRYITGSLTIDPGYVATTTLLSLPRLTDIGGDLILDNITGNLYEIHLGSLGYVTGRISCQNSIRLSNLDLPNLVQAASLTIRSPISTLDVPHLTTVFGALSIRDTTLTTLSLPFLTSAGNTTLINGGTLTSISAPNLATVASLDIEVGGPGGALTSLDLTSLITVTNTLVIRDEPIATLAFPALTSAGVFQITGCRSLTTLSVPVLDTVGLLSVTSTDVLTTLSFPSLTTVSSPYGPGLLVQIEYNAGLTMIDLTALTEVIGGTGVGSIQIQSNPDLTSLMLSPTGFVRLGTALDNSGSFTVTDNITLSTTDVQAIGVALRGHGWSGLFINIANQPPTGVWPWDLSISNATEATFFGGLTEIGGVVTIQAPFTGDFALSDLATLGTGLTVSGAAGLTSVSLPSLTTLNGSIFLVGCSNLAEVLIPLLTTISSMIHDTSLVIYACGNHTDHVAVDLTSLETTTGQIQVNTSYVQTLSLPALTTMGPLRILHCVDLTTLSAPLLVTTGECTLSEDYLLTSLDFSSLTTTIDLTFENLGSLTTIAIPDLANAGSLSITDNAALTTVTVTPATFTNLGGGSGTLTISYNPSYLDTAAQTIANDLFTFGGWTGTFNHTGNL